MKMENTTQETLFPEAGEQKEENEYGVKLSKREKIVAVLWIAIGLIQVILGILYLNQQSEMFVLFGIDVFKWLMIVIGFWNIIVAIKRINDSEDVKEPYDGIVEEYDKHKIPLVVCAAVNISLGLLIGIYYWWGYGIISGVAGLAGACCDFFVLRRFVVKHREEFEGKYAEEVKEENVSLAATV